MSLESDILILGEVPLFADLTRDQLRLLAFGAEHRFLHPKETLFRAEARADAGFVLVEGTVNLYRGEADRRELLASVGRGALLGELALMTETRRAATAVTATDCDFIRISRPLFRRMLQEYPEIAAMLHARISSELADMTGRILSLEDRFRDDDSE